MSPVVTVRVPELTPPLNAAPVDRLRVPVVAPLVEEEGEREGSLGLLPMKTDPEAKGEEEVREVDTPVARVTDPGMMLLPPELLLLPPEMSDTLPP